MAHFARLDENSVVVEVIVIDNDAMLDENDVEQESLGVEVCNTLFGEGFTWVQTSYNASMRGRFAGVGYTYDSTNDVFIRPQPYPSWTLDDNFDWQAPVAFPSDGFTGEVMEGVKYYHWDEDTLNWVETV